SNCSCNINANVWASVCPVGLITSAAQLKILSLSPSPSASLETSNACWTLASTCACCNFSHSCSAKHRLKYFHEFDWNNIKILDEKNKNSLNMQTNTELLKLGLFRYAQQKLMFSCLQYILFLPLRYFCNRHCQMTCNMQTNNISNNTPDIIM
ncbi:hypothetical protein ALC53_08706, partial [Atta colombica]